MTLDDVKLYRITHVLNVPYVLQYGIVRSNSVYASSSYVSIGDMELISARSSKRVVVNNGDVFSMVGTIMLGEFVPFYFDVRMPMLYVVQHGGNFVSQVTPPEDIVYLICLLSDIMRSGCSYYFSDGHPMDLLTSFYDSSQVAKLPYILDWVAIKSQYWGGEGRLDIKRKKQAEFLVGNDIAPEYLCGFGCYNAVARERLLRVGVPDRQIVVMPNAYY
jgi:hypothetical protein